MKIIFTLLVLVLCLTLALAYAKKINPGAPAAPEKAARVAGKVAAGKATPPLIIDRLTES